MPQNYDLPEWAAKEQIERAKKLMPELFDQPFNEECASCKKVFCTNSWKRCDICKQRIHSSCTKVRTRSPLGVFFCFPCAEENDSKGYVVKKDSRFDEK